MGRIGIVDARIGIESGAWTETYCGDETMRDRQFHDDLLRIARRDIVAGGTLEACDGKGVLLSRFRRALGED